jgi:hypothetical protein
MPWPNAKVFSKYKEKITGPAEENFETCLAVFVWDSTWLTALRRTLHGHPIILPGVL